MTVIKTKAPCFRCFLDKKNAYERFRRNLWTEKKLTVNQFLKSENQRYYFINSFVWDDTPEGYDFWDELSNDWNEILNKNT